MDIYNLFGLSETANSASGSTKKRSVPPPADESEESYAAAPYTLPIVLNRVKSDSGVIAALLSGLIAKVESGRIHQCQHCPKSFKLKVTLKRHVDAHMQIKKFQCADCDYCAVRRCALTSHIQTKHLHPKPKPASYYEGKHRCSFCGFGSDRKLDVTRHERIHLKLKPFHCLQCSYRTAAKCNLVEHLKNGSHQMVRPAKRQRTE